MRRTKCSSSAKAIYSLSLLCLLTAPAVAADSTRQSEREWPTDYTKTEWPTFGGDYANTRFSKLAKINRGNVHRLELKWSFDTQLPYDPWYLFETNPIVVDGVMYVTDPGNFGSLRQSVVALNAKSGAFIWRQDLIFDQAPENVGQISVRANRGVAVGGSRVFVAGNDATLWSLDAATGAPVAAFGQGGRVVVADVDAGYFLTAAPIFVPRHLVPTGGAGSGRDLILIGIAGGENESRGFMNAYDAKSGHLVWRFFTVPAPGEFGGDTWPNISDGPFADPFSRGGAAPWMSPAYDSDTGLVIFGTGNPGPDYDGTHCHGTNLFSVSVVAVDIRNGQRRWHFQEVHHDLWDSDQSSPPVLFEVKRKGNPVKAVGAAGKTGWFYILDRATGEPLIPCPERPVSTATNVVAPDGAVEQPWPTQPHCESDPFVPQGDRFNAAGDYIYPIFTPPLLPDVPVVLGPLKFPQTVPDILPMVPISNRLTEPGHLGGADWTPVSFNPNLNYAYISGNIWPARFTVRPEAAPTPGKPGEGGYFSYTLDDYYRIGGTLSAMDVSTGKIKWQVITGIPTYGGTCATAGNLVFVGEGDDGGDPSRPLANSAYFSAFDAKSGERLFRFRVPNDTWIVAPCITYSIDGEQFVAVAAGGNIGVPEKTGTIYVFGLPEK